MNHIIIPVHSAIDVITNSSTELFVTNKITLEAAESIIEHLKEAYYAAGNEQVPDESIEIKYCQDEIDRLDPEYHPNTIKILKKGGKNGIVISCYDECGCPFAFIEFLQDAIDGESYRM